MKFPDLNHVVNHSHLETLTRTIITEYLLNAPCQLAKHGLCLNMVCVMNYFQPFDLYAINIPCYVDVEIARYVILGKLPISF